MLPWATRNGCPIFGAFLSRLRWVIVREHDLSFISGECWIFAAAKMGFELRIAAPRKYQPSPSLLEQAGGKIVLTENMREGCSGAEEEASYEEKGA